MPWNYSQSTGRLSYNGNLVANGYSGRGAGRNNPVFEGVNNIGPIPRGQYRIGAPRNSRRTGAYVLDLTPVGHHAHGRHDFQVHGERRAGVPGEASSGCIIVPRDIRERMARSGDAVLEVNE